MVKVDILLYGGLARIADKKKVFIDASNLRGALQGLEKLGEEFNRRLFDGRGNPSRFINIYVNGRDVRFLDKLDTVLNEGDIISLMPAVSGG